MNNEYKSYEDVLEDTINEVLDEKIQKLKIVKNIVSHISLRWLTIQILS